MSDSAIDGERTAWGVSHESLSGDAPKGWRNLHWKRRTGFADWEHLELTANGVINYQDDGRDLAARWTFEQVLAGDIDDMVRNLFGGRVLEEIKEAARARSRRPSAPG